MVDLDMHDVLVAADRPIGAVEAVGAPMHRVLPAQPGEVGMPDVVLIKLRVADIDLSSGIE